MDTENLTKEKLTAISEKIAKRMEENKIVGSANMIAYVMKESWFAGFEEGPNIRLRNRSGQSNDIRVYSSSIKSHLPPRSPRATVPVLQDIHAADQLQRYVCSYSRRKFRRLERRTLMTENVNVQYVGFEAKALVREYSFIVRRALNETSEFTLTIGNEAFGSRRVRFQDAPEICSLRLHRELAVFGDHPPQAHYHISETDLDDYRSSHAPKVWGSPYKPKAPRDL